MNDKKILLVDDDTDMLMMTERWLIKDGYTVITASSGADAVSILKNEKPDLILLDYSMPGMDGPDTLREIRNNPDTKELNVFFLTGMEEPDAVKLAGELNIQGYIQKSAGKKAILSALSDFLG